MQTVYAMIVILSVFGPFILLGMVLFGKRAGVWWKRRKILHTYARQVEMRPRIFESERSLRARYAKHVNSLGR